MPRRIEPDDEVHRFNAVWLGPPGTDLPFHVRYIAYAVGALVFAAIILFEALTPIPIGLPPVWEFCIAVLFTAFVMQAVDHDKPVGAIVGSVVLALRTRQRRTGPARVRPTFGTLVKVTKEPL